MMANQALHLCHTKQQQDKGVTRVMVEVWCENQRGEKTVIGTASGALD